MHLSKEKISELERRRRANLINSVSGYKPANLIGTISSTGATNVAVFSSVVHIGADPPLLGFIMRPLGEVDRHTYDNIDNTGVYTVNQIGRSFIGRAHYTSAKFDRGVSEFYACGLTEEFIEDFPAPFVAESEVKIGLRLVDKIPIELNGTILIIGEIEHLVFPEKAWLDRGNLDLESIEAACISGLDTYLSAETLAVFPYAKPENLPNFSLQEPGVHDQKD